nr:o-succinylbenzoate--CoA ligase [Hoyosella subflava]
MTILRTLPIPAGKSVLGLLPHLEKALNGQASWLPVPEYDEREARRLTVALKAGEPIDPGISLVVATSGTTGTPKGAMVTASALRASIDASHHRIGGPGRWVLALPPHHIAGLQVLLRAIISGTTPVVIDVRNGFDPAGFATTVQRAAREPGPLYVSLVPGQLIKAIEYPAAVAALRECSAVLIGGAALPPNVSAQAHEHSIPVIRTYGMSETCGGCVYDGVPLEGARVRIDNGRVVLGGTMLAVGYRNLPGHPAFGEAGWFRTDDAGSLSRGILTVHGRLDEAISTGGLTIVPQVVESALAKLPSVRECAVVGLRDPRLGERVVAAIIAVPGATVSLAEARRAVTDQLDSTAAPRQIFLMSDLPLLSSGKVDRAALRNMLQN